MNDSKAKLITMIKLFCEGYSTKLEHAGKTTEDITVESILIIIVDWIMKELSEHKTGIRWTLTTI